MFKFFKKKLPVVIESDKYLKYSFIDNSILLRTSVIEKKGFREIWRQQNDENSVQILCFNEKTGEFQAFDRFHWMIENMDEGFIVGWFSKDHLWTPIKLHFTEKWLREHLISNYATRKVNADDRMRYLCACINYLPCDDLDHLKLM